jgi:hypothetical protein
MGFYLELVPQGKECQEFRELPPPVSFWVLYAVGVFALICMGAAAYSVLGGLFAQGSIWDGIILGTVGLFLALFLFIGIKMLALRKFVRLKTDELQVGFFVFGRPFRLHNYLRSDIKEVCLINQRPTPNLAPEFHDDPQYFVRGHWRLVLDLKKPKRVVLDKHVEREALIPLFNSIESWFKEKTN